MYALLKKAFDFLSGDAGMIVAIFIGVSGVAAICVGWFEHKMSVAYDNGVSVERAAQIIESRKMQEQYERRLAAVQYKVNGITRAESDRRKADRDRTAKLQSELLSAPDEDYIAPIDRPVFSERMRNRLNAFGYD